MYTEPSVIPPQCCGRGACLSLRQQDRGDDRAGWVFATRAEAEMLDLMRATGWTAEYFFAMVNRARWASSDDKGDNIDAKGLRNLTNVAVVTAEAVASDLEDTTLVGSCVGADEDGDGGEADDGNDWREGAASSPPTHATSSVLLSQRLLPNSLIRRGKEPPNWVARSQSQSSPLSRWRHGCWYATKRALPTAGN